MGKIGRAGLVLALIVAAAVSFTASAPAGAESPTHLGGVITARPSCASDDHQSLHCFVRGTDNNLYERVRSPRGAWSGWARISSMTMAGAPDCLGKGPGAMSCFFRTAGNTLGEASFWGGSWHDHDQGGTIASDPDCYTLRTGAGASDTQNMGCFAFNSAGQLVGRTYAGGWRPWLNLGGGNVIGKPSCFSTDLLNRVDCMEVNAVGDMWQTYSTNGGASFVGWYKIATGFSSEPSCLARQTGWYECFAKSSTNSLKQTWWTGSTWDTYDLGGGLSAAPDCVSHRGGDIGCFVRGTGGEIYSKILRAGSTWTSYASPGWKMNGPAGCTAGVDDEYDCGAWGTDNAMWNWRENKVAPTLADITQLGTHNSFANYEDSRWSGPNQSKSIGNQLSSGVRSFMLDTYQFESGTGLCIISFGSDCYPNDVYLCHGGCTSLAGVTYALPRQRYRDALGTIVNFLNANPSEIVTVYLEDYTTPAQLKAAQDQVSGLSNVLFNPVAWNVRGRGWPTLQEMRNANDRLVIMSDDGGREYFGVVRDSDYTTQNYWSIGDNGDQLQCTARWSGVPLDKVEPGFRRLFVMNHFRNAPTAPTASADNGTKLRDRISNQCMAASGREPNVVAVDFFELPGSSPNPRSIVAELNAG